MLRSSLGGNPDGSHLPIASTTDPTAPAEKMEYIPLEYAQKKINKLVADYTTLKTHYDEHISQLNDFHMKTNAEMKDYYETFIRDLKRKALEHLTVVKAEKLSLDARLTEELTSKDAIIESLREALANKSTGSVDNARQAKPLSVEGAGVDVTRVQEGGSLPPRVDLQEESSALAESVRSEAAEASREHRELTSKLVAGYEARVKALEQQVSQSAQPLPGAVLALQDEHDSLTASLVRTYEEKISVLRTRLQENGALEELQGLESSVEALHREASDMRAVSHSSARSSMGETASGDALGVVGGGALNIQRSLTLAAQRENATLKDTIASLEMRVADMSLRLGQLAAAGTRKVRLEGDASAANEELEEEVYRLQVELARVECENADNASERASLHAQLDEMIKEKRTDVVARFEEDVRVLRSELLHSRESQATLKEERARGELKTKELKERCDKAEGELRDRDERELALLSPLEEAAMLRTMVSKQREDIIMRSERASAGWDAAAAADKRLVMDVDVAYHRGLVEAEDRHSFAMTALNEAIEKKESRITELLVSIAASEKSKKQLEMQLIEAKERAQGGRAYLGLGEDGDVSQAELQEARDTLDSAHEEVAAMAARIEGQRVALERANRMVDIYEKLEVAYSSAWLDGPGTGGSTGGGGSDVKDVINAVKSAVIEGTKLWRRGARDSCFDLYMKVSKDSYDKLNKSQFSGSPFVVLFKEGLDPIVASTRTGTSKDKDKGAVGLRKILDRLLVDCEEAKANSVKEGRASIGSMSGASVESAVASTQVQVLLSELAALTEGRARGEQPESDHTAQSILRRARAAEVAVDELKLQLSELMKTSDGAEEDKSSLRSRASIGVGVSPVEYKKLEKRAKDLEAQLARGGGVELETIENKHSKQMHDAEAASHRLVQTLEDKLAKLTTEHSGAAERIESLTTEVSSYKSKVQEMTALMAEMESLKAKASQLAELKEQLDSQVQQYTMLSEQFKKENALRKKYKNELEDLKGSIRLYARCRPMAGYELEKGCQTVVRFTDDTSLRVSGSRGDKDFEFDAAFNWNSTQEEVFEDTRRLVESCLDGFNVCVFAYGQTGSGKTHTMTGSPGLPGLTPRAVAEVFHLISLKKHAKCSVSTYFIELYNDNLVDLFWILDNAKTKKKGGQPEDPPKLDIRLDAKNMVFVRNAIVKDVGSAEELMDLFNKGNAERHTGATKMNASSSRSHSIFAIMVETVDSVTKKTITGKLSLVDLAGSERADKTGASPERLKEAQNINKSLSALGDVIAALSEGEKFIPYRNNKLTQLMQDSLGGNAKTLMFVNFSPADYNADETTTSLQYAARVKKIVNNASKQAESEEVTRLKNIIRKLQSGVAVAPDELEMPPSKMEPIPVIATAEDPDAKEEEPSSDA